MTSKLAKPRGSLRTVLIYAATGAVVGLSAFVGVDIQDIDFPGLLLQVGSVLDTRLP